MGGGASRVHMGGEPGSVRGTCDDEGGSSPVTDYHNCMTRRRRIDDRVSSPTASDVVNALAKAIGLGENGSIFPRPKGKAR